MSSFPSQKRLLNSLEFKNILSSPEIKFSNAAFGLYVQINSSSDILIDSRLGLAITKRHLKKAVQRNTAKRIVRESFRLQHLSQRVSVVVMSRHELVRFDKKEMRRQIEELWARLNKKLSKPLVSLASS